MWPPSLYLGHMAPRLCLDLNHMGPRLNLNLGHVTLTYENFILF